MKLVWSPQSVEDLSSIRQYITLDDPRAASGIAATIVALVATQLPQFPHSGRPGRVAGTFELVVPKTPFIVPYCVTGKTINILAVHHASRRWPESFGSE